jgi:hypothetical protein
MNTAVRTEKAGLAQDAWEKVGIRNFKSIELFEGYS